MASKVSMYWFRRDLRLHDNAGLFAALTSGNPIVPIFIFDRNILDKLENKYDARVSFLHEQVKNLKEKVEEIGGHFEVRYGYPEEVWKELSQKHDLVTVYANRDYEPYATERDEAVLKILKSQRCSLELSKDHVIFEADEVQKKQGGHYTVFTPYSRTWLDLLEENHIETANGEKVSLHLAPHPSEDNIEKFKLTQSLLESFSENKDMLSLGDMGFQLSSKPQSPTDSMEIPPAVAKTETIETYDATRNFPALRGTTRIGIHLRHGTMSIREVARKAVGLNKTYLSELIWRDFYSQVLAVNPRVVTESFRPDYDAIEWINNEDHFAAWCEGKTGYPLVDAGMRELNETGFMHNRVRMVTASFLTKHLLTDWRWGEHYFAEKLLDYDLASNNGGWQWAAGCGTDAAPYFRVFNPESQLTKFDKDLKYVKRWVPEVETTKYPKPIVEHSFARQRALDVYKAGLEKARS